MPKDELSRPPWIPFFCKDWIAKTVGLSLEEEGAYIRLFNAARTTADDWSSLPDDDRRLARIVGCGMKKWLTLRRCLVPEFFFAHDRRLVNIRLQECASKQLEKRQQSSLAGQESGRSRANARSTTVQTTVQRNGERKVNHEVEDTDSEESTDSPASRSLEPVPAPTPSEGNQPKIVRAARSPFTRPTLAEVMAYCADREAAGKPRVDPEAWLDHYVSNGWRVGRSPMRDWRAAVRQWERNGLVNGNGTARRPGYTAKGGLTAEAAMAFAKDLKRQEAESGQA